MIIQNTLTRGKSKNKLSGISKKKQISSQTKEDTSGKKKSKYVAKTKRKKTNQNETNKQEKKTTTIEYSLDKRKREVQELIIPFKKALWSAHH